MNSFGFELILLFLSQFLILMHLLFELIFEVGDLFLELWNLSQISLFFGEELWEFWVNFLGDVLEGEIGDERGIGEWEIGDRRFILSLEPVGDGIAFVRMAVGSDDGVEDGWFGDGAGALLLKGFDEVVVFSVHIKIIYIKSIFRVEFNWGIVVISYTWVFICVLHFGIGGKLVVFGKFCIWCLGDWYYPNGIMRITLIFD